MSAMSDDMVQMYELSTTELIEKLRRERSRSSKLRAALEVARDDLSDAAKGAPLACSRLAAEVVRTRLADDAQERLVDDA